MTGLRIRDAPISEGGAESGRSQSTGIQGRAPLLVSEGAVMLESLRKKKETEMQLRMIENRIRRLKDEEHQAKIKQQMQLRQIDAIIRIRTQAQEEKEIQRKRKEEIMREVEERKAKVSLDKRVINMGRIRSVRKHNGDIKRLVEDLRNESKIRSM
jgi:TolA-binding protein